MWTENNTQDELIKGVLRHGPKILELCQSTDDLSSYFQILEKEHLNYPRPKNKIDSANWFIPKEYQELDIVEFLIEQSPKENLERLIQEINLFQQNNMITMLKTMKYVVDTLRENNVVWGVGRGSSVASYALYLIGVHKVDSIKYNLPIDEFFKGE